MRKSELTREKQRLLWEAAYKKFSKMFEEHKDYDGSFRIMKGFLIRNKKRKEYNHLYDQLMADPPDISYEQPQFYADRVREELLDWKRRKSYEQSTCDWLRRSSQCSNPEMLSDRKSVV